MPHLTPKFYVGRIRKEIVAEFHESRIRKQPETEIHDAETLRAIMPCSTGQLVEMPKSSIDSFFYYILSPEGQIVKKSSQIGEPVSLGCSRFRFRTGSSSLLQLDHKPPCVDLEAVYNAMLYFGWPQSFTNLVRTSSVHPSRLSRLPVELRLRILNSLPLKYVHRTLNVAFPDLATLHLENIALRFEAWLSKTCSRDNMRYVATRVAGGGIYEIYRLRSSEYDQWPNFSIASSPQLPDIQPFAPSLQCARTSLAIAIEWYFWASTIFWEYVHPQQDVHNPNVESIWRAGQVRASFTTTPATREEAKVPESENGDPANKRGFMIMLDQMLIRTTAPIEIDEDPEGKYDFKCTELGQAVFILEEELADILDDFRYFVMPRLCELRSIDNPERLSHFPEDMRIPTWNEVQSWIAMAKGVLDMEFPLEHIGSL